VGAEIVRALHGAGANALVHYRSSRGRRDSAGDELNRDSPGSAAIHGADLLERSSAGHRWSRRALTRLRPHRCAHQQRLDVLPDADRLDHVRAVGRSDRQQLEGAAVPVAGGRAQPAQARGGLIINIVDMHGLRPLEGHPVYSAAKAGLAMLTRSLARELGPEIRVNGIAPGPVLWPEQDHG
jgi:pteridine reductase